MTRRPKYAYRSYTDGVVQAPAPARLIQSGMPTEAIFAQVLPLTPTRGLLANREWVADASIAWRVTDETRAPILDPYTRKIKTGYFWALASDDRPWGGTAPPGVAFTYGPERGGLHAKRKLRALVASFRSPFMLCKQTIAGQRTAMPDMIA